LTQCARQEDTISATAVLRRKTVPAQGEFPDDAPGSVETVPAATIEALCHAG
jgi:hypothetical protein